MRVLLLNPPSFERYDSVGARFQATRKTKSMWYPIWLCHAAGVLDESKVVDCPAENIGVDKIFGIVDGYDMAVIHTSTPSITNDVAVADLIKGYREDIKVLFVGAHVSVLPEEILRMSDSIDGAVRREYEYALSEISEGRKWSEIRGLSWRKDGRIIHNPDRPLMQDLDGLPFVTRIYKRDLSIPSYYLPFTLHPYVSMMTARGCPHRCTFCLWPQTFTGRRYRTRSPENVAEECRAVKEELPEVKEIFFDDDTFTSSRPHVERICDLVRPLDITWSANARADVEYKTLASMKESGCRLLVVGYESGSQKILDNVKKGITVRRMRRFTRDCQRLDIMIHGCFILGLPGETEETMEETIDFAIDLDVDTIQCAVATPFPGTEFYKQCVEEGYIRMGELTDRYGYQSCIIDLPSLSSDRIVEAVDDFHVRYLYRPRFFYKTLQQMMRKPWEIGRIYRDAMEFQSYIIRRLFGRVLA